MDAKVRIRSAALKLFNKIGYEATSIAEICRRSKVSNGSFFHAYTTKEALGADLFLTALEDYHAAMTSSLVASPGARAGISAMLHAHLGWVVASEPMARILFEQVRPEWLAHVRDRQSQENERFAAAITGWREPLVKSGDIVNLPQLVFIAQLIGPAQIFCRAWLSGRSAKSPQDHSAQLIACAWRALLA